MSSCSFLSIYKAAAVKSFKANSWKDGTQATRLLSDAWNCFSWCLVWTSCFGVFVSSLTLINLIQRSLVLATPITAENRLYRHISVTFHYELVGRFQYSYTDACNDVRCRCCVFVKTRLSKNDGRLASPFSAGFATGYGGIRRRLETAEHFIRLTVAIWEALLCIDSHRN